jgi:hypothetical protein
MLKIYLCISSYFVHIVDYLLKNLRFTRFPERLQTMIKDYFWNIHKFSLVSCALTYGPTAGLVNFFIFLDFNTITLFSCHYAVLLRVFINPQPSIFLNWKAEWILSVWIKWNVSGLFSQFRKQTIKSSHAEGYTNSEHGATETFHIAFYRSMLILPFRIKLKYKYQILYSEQNPHKILIGI